MVCIKPDLQNGLHLLSRGHPAGSRTGWYVEEFVSLCHSWSDYLLNPVFLNGLDGDLISLNMQPDMEEYSLENFINRVLQAVGSEFCVWDSDEDLRDGSPVPVASMLTRMADGVPIHSPFVLRNQRGITCDFPWAFRLRT